MAGARSELDEEGESVGDGGEVSSDSEVIVADESSFEVSVDDTAVVVVLVGADFELVRGCVGVFLADEERGCPFFEAGLIIILYMGCYKRD